MEDRAVVAIGIILMALMFCGAVIYTCSSVAYGGEKGYYTSMGYGYI